MDRGGRLQRTVTYHNTSALVHKKAIYRLLNHPSAIIVKLHASFLSSRAVQIFRLFV